MLTLFLVLTVFVATPYLLVSARDLIWDIYLWQTKEYRLDRVWSQWRYEKDKGKRGELMLMLKIALAVFIGIFMYFPKEQFLLAAFLIAYFVYWYEALVFIQKLVKRKLLRFQLKSVRNLLIAGFSLVVMVLPLAVLMFWLGSLNYSSTSADLTQVALKMPESLDQVVQTFIPKDVTGVTVLRPEYIIVSLVSLISILIGLLQPVLVALAVFLTWPLAALKRRFVILRAKTKLKQMKELKVIAVTGSYGKSTTKELLFQILRVRFDTVKTEKNNNTDIGIAQTILKKITPKTEVFVAEMGAYKLGETSACCRLAPPDVAIITGVDQQHVSLFGGIREVMASTYEVVEELKPAGLLILNGDNEYCVRIAEKTAKRKILYFSIHNTSKVEASELDVDDAEARIGHKVSFPANENIFVKAISMTNRGLSFELNFESRLYKIQTNLKAIYNISNLMAAILTAHELGMSMKEVIGVINALEFEVPYLNIYDGVNDSRVLDDGYNTNPTGFIAALKYLNGLHIKSKKWIMTQGLIELGPERAATNKKIAEVLVEVADVLYTTDSALYEQVKQTDPKFEVRLINSVFDIPPYYKHLVKQGELVLLEGSFPQDVLKQVYLKYYH